LKSNLASTVGHARPERLRTVFCTRGGLFGALVLSRLRKCDRIEICAIVRSSRTFHPVFGFLRGALAYIRRSGFAYSLYLFCTTTLADLLCAFAPIGCVPLRTRRKGIPVHTTRDINDADGLSFLRGCAPDLIVSAFFDQRLQEAVLSVPARGCINIHPSLLPSFRGVDPVLQARLHRLAPLGVTVHYMTPALDTGNILVQGTMTVPERASIFETTALLYCEGAGLLVSQIDGVESGVTGTPQRAGSSYQSWPTRDDIRGLRALGSVLIRLTDVTRFLTFVRKAPAVRYSRTSL
jgi:methionyl-tRNA formyltransferase